MTPKMTSHAKTKAPPSEVVVLTKTESNLPALIVTGRESIAIRAGTVFAGLTFAEETPIAMRPSGYEVGADYIVVISPDGLPFILKVEGSDKIWDKDRIGGFHFAPGGNALARAGGDDVPAINPFSVWDINFRPACADPRGMTLVDGRFWCDIYLTGANHLTDGTSKFGATIADGNDRPKMPDGKKAKSFDYDVAAAVMAHHGKGLLSLEEFFAAAFGVIERTARDGDPETAGPDAPRTSKWGLMQATGNLWVWGHDGDPDEPRPSVFGGSWWNDDSAGSRYADVDYWADNSGGSLGARGRSDHLQRV